MRKTHFFEIPYRSDSDSFDPMLEQRQMQLLDSLLFAGTCGISKALFEDGEYVAADNGDGTYTLLVMPSPEYAVLGILKNRLFYSKDTITFTGLRKGKVYYVYASYGPKMDSDPLQFVRTATTTKFPAEADMLILCTVDFTGDQPVINEDPQDKIYSDDILAHTGDTSNPHGRTLTQDILNVVEHQFIRGSPVHPSRMASVVSNGMAGVKVPATLGETAFVGVMPLGDIGRFWFRKDSDAWTLLCENTGIPVNLEIKLK